MASNFPTSFNDLHRAAAANSPGSVVVQLKRSDLSCCNRLLSIQHDSNFILRVERKLQLPLVANERCGSWYIPTEKKHASVYFKSTDGHHGQWLFSTRRLNVHRLKMIGDRGGCIIVDSTRRGKSMPDALSKTVPIWCAVINRLLFPEQQDSHNVRLPISVVGPSEGAQIMAKIEGHLETAKHLSLDIETLRADLQRPMQVCWKTPQGEDGDASEIRRAGRNVIVCCTASSHIHGGNRPIEGYVQGAGDDAENWAHGLTPEILWEHRRDLFTEAASRSDHLLEDSILSRIPMHRSGPRNAVHQVGDTPLFFGCLHDVEALRERKARYEAAILCGEQADVTPLLVPSASDTQENFSMRSNILKLKCKHGKQGSRDLRHEFSKIPGFLEHQRTQLKRDPKLLIVCSTGVDHSAGVALVVMCLRLGLVPNTPHNVRQWPKELTKDVKDKRKIFIQSTLASLTLSNPQVALSRATITSINSFLAPHEWATPGFR